MANENTDWVKEKLKFNIELLKLYVPIIAAVGAFIVIKFNEENTEVLSDSKESLLFISAFFLAVCICGTIITLFQIEYFFNLLKKKS